MGKQTGKTAKIVEKKAGGQDANVAGNGWDAPVGLKCHGMYAAIVGGKTKAVHVSSHAIALQEPAKPKVKELQRLAELPPTCWTNVPNEVGGTQFMTRFGIGIRKEVVMLDGGSGVNTIPEDTVVSILNHCKSAGLALSSAAHLIKQLENWSQQEELRRRERKNGAPIRSSRSRVAVSGSG